MLRVSSANELFFSEVLPIKKRNKSRCGAMVYDDSGTNALLSEQPGPEEARV